MNYELAKKLKDAEFPQESEISSSICDEGSLRSYDIEPCYYPTLSELIKACGDGLKDMTKIGKFHEKPEGSWMTNNISSPRTYGETLDIAVANLWLELNKKI